MSNVNVGLMLGERTARGVAVSQLVPESSLQPYFDITSYGALDSPSDIGPAVQRAANACIAYGGGVVFIPPRVDARQWGWTTAVLVDCTQDRSISFQGVPGQTAISLQVGQTTPLTFPNSNGICQVDGLIFTGQGVLGDTNCACVIDFQQSRVGIVSRCQFFGCQCDGTGQGVIRLVADTTVVRDCLFAGCCYAGTAFQGGVLSVTGNRDASIVENVRFSNGIGSDGNFDGVNYRKTDFALNWAWLWYGAQGVDGAVTAYGEVQTKRCYFESEARAGIDCSPEAGFISDHHRIEGCTFNFGAGGGARPGIKFSTVNGSTRTKRVEVVGCMFGNAASGNACIDAECGALILDACRNLNVPGHTYKVTLLGATDYVLFNESDGFVLDTTTATPAFFSAVLNGAMLPTTAPAAPPAQGYYVYVDAADNTLKAKASTGTVTPIALP